MFTLQEILKATKGRCLYPKDGLRIKGISTDSRSVKTGECFLAIRGENFNGHDFIDTAVKQGAACIIVDTIDVRFNRQAAKNRVSIVIVKDTVKALGDLANFHRKRFDIPVIAITGSNGKTTTKDMIAWILSEKFCVLKTEGTKNNNIGLPQTLLRLKRQHGACVLELGTNHFGEIKELAAIAEPDIGIITNIGPSHIEYFRDLQGVLREKYSLIEGLKQPCLSIVNYDDPLLYSKTHPRSKPFTLGFGIKKPCDFRAGDVKKSDSQIIFTINHRQKMSIKTLGLGNVYNCLAAAACSRILGMNYQKIADRLSNFDFPKGRLNLIRYKQKNFIDDTYNSSPASLSLALKSLEDFKAKGNKIFVMGDMLELGKDSLTYHYKAGLEAAKVCDKLIAVGPLSRQAIKAAKTLGFCKNDLFVCSCANEAKDILFHRLSISKDDIVLVKGSRRMKLDEIFLDIRK